MFSSILIEIFLYFSCIILINQLVLYITKQIHIWQVLKVIPGPGIIETIKLTWWAVYGSGGDDDVGTKISNLCTHLADTYGQETGVIKLWNGIFPPYIFICSAPLAKLTLAHSELQNKADIYRFLGRVITGNGLLTCEASKATAYRREFSEHFKNYSLESYMKTFQYNLTIFEEHIERSISENSGICDIKRALSTLILDSLGDNLFSTRFNSQNAQTEPSFVSAIEGCLTQADKLLLQQWRITFQPLPLAAIAGFLDHCLVETAKIVKSIITFKCSMWCIVLRRYRCLVESKKYTERHSLLDSTIKSRMMTDKLSLFGLASGLNESLWHVSIFTLAGHQTSTATLTWILYYLCRHQAVQRKLQLEIDQQPDQIPTIASLKSLKYLECVIKEIMRLAPAAPYLGRKAQRDLLLPTIELTIPASSNVIILAQYLHSREDYFKNATKFIPERFENSESGWFTGAAYLPFSAGKRSCIGLEYAMLQMKLALVYLMRRYSFELAEEVGMEDIKPKHHMVQGPARFSIRFMRRC